MPENRQTKRLVKIQLSYVPPQYSLAVVLRTSPYEVVASRVVDLQPLTVVSEGQVMVLLNFAQW
jgi:hypothetical protein